MAKRLDGMSSGGRKKSLSYQLVTARPAAVPIESQPSKTRRKQEVAELQELGEALVGLSTDQLAQIDLPERLLDAVLAARKISAFSARRRQLQYIGKIMRDVDPAPIREKIDAWTASTHEKTARLHGVERWRQRLLDDESALTELMAEHPRADSRELLLLIRSTHREREQGRPPRSYRALFQSLRDILIPD
jgi:ribosome-associated protein